MAFPSNDFRPAAILCNGPSLRGFNFAQELSGYATFGMNAAYRYWEKINWYPEHYACLDVALGLSHKDAIASLIKHSKELGIHHFLLRENLIQALGELGQRPEVSCLETLFETVPTIFRSRRITTGSHTLLWAAWLGYKDLILLGADANYTELLPEARQIGDLKLEITTTPKHNPNYFFDDYQRKGDIYHVPNPNADKGDRVHVAAWETICPSLDALGAVVVNANPQSNVKAFPKCCFADVRETLTAIHSNRDALLKKFDAVRGFPRDAGVHLDELRIFYPFLPKQDGIMIDVGAHFGGSCRRFLRRGWKVYAFEPDPNVRQTLIKNVAGEKNIIIDPRAVSRISGREYPWFTTPDSSGAGSMKPFSTKHTQAGSVTTVTLADIIDQYNITHIDLLKIDAEGFDFMVLQGFPFNRLRPDHILCEFEDAKTLPLGCSTHELAHLLIQQGYTLFISEWHPIVRYGIPHQWHTFTPYPAPLDSASSWGNILAFATPPDSDLLAATVAEAIQPGKSMPEGVKHD